MNIIRIIKKPILTEKTHNNILKNIYTFEVLKQSNKIEIKKAFEIIFEVKIKKINIINYNPKVKKIGKFIGKTIYSKRAIISLKKGEKLDLFKKNK